MVNQMLRQANGVKLAVLVNEFGALPIDEDLIEAQDDELISIAGGCICSSFGSDLTAAMINLTELSPAPDHIIIETSGVALPGAIAHSLSILPGITVDGICVLADCANVKTQASDDYIGATITRQFADAKLLLLTKADLVSHTVLADVQNWLASSWPNTRQIVAEQGRVPNAVLLGQFTVSGSFSVGKHHDAAYDSVFLACRTPRDVAALVTQMTEPKLGVLRAKGFVEDLSGRRALVQIVGATSEVTYPDAPAGLGVICIGLAGVLDKAALLEMGEDALA